VLFALFIGLLVWALMRLMNHDHARHAPVGGPWQGRDEALNAARMRYARGELDRDQYFRMVEDLTGVPRPVDPAAPANPAGTGGSNSRRMLIRPFSCFMTSITLIDPPSVPLTVLPADLRMSAKVMKG